MTLQGALSPSLPGRSPASPWHRLCHRRLQLGRWSQDDPDLRAAKGFGSQSLLGDSSRPVGGGVRFGIKEVGFRVSIRLGVQDFASWVLLTLGV